MVVFLLLWSFLVLQRLAEVRRAGDNTAKLLREGAREFSPGHYPVMVSLHTAWFASWLLEVWLQGPRWSLVWLFPALLGQALRYWAQSTLGARWTTRILVFAGERPKVAGPFRYFRHPNYLGVVLELLSFPMLLGAWRCAIGVSLANLALLWWRVGQEEKAWKTSGI